LLQSEIPGDWCQLLPNIKFNSPDRLLGPNTLPLLKFLPRLANEAPSPYGALIDRLIDAQAGLNFRQTYLAEDFNARWQRQRNFLALNSLKMSGA